MTADNIIKIISSIATLSVSITIAIFTYKLSKAQKDIALEKYKLDLYDRRYDIYGKYVCAIECLEEEVHYKPKYINKKLESIVDEIYYLNPQIEFLFDKEIDLFLKDIFKKINIIIDNRKLINKVYRKYDKIYFIEDFYVKILRKTDFFLRTFNINLRSKYKNTIGGNEYYAYSHPILNKCDADIMSNEENININYLYLTNIFKDGTFSKKFMPFLKVNNLK